jgi:hypothetical protein
MFSDGRVDFKYLSKKELTIVASLMTNFNPRYDILIIWGHGLDNFDKKFHLIEQDTSFGIIAVKKVKIGNMARFVKSVYSYDYAPFRHLREKTKYLSDVKKEAAFIVLHNKSPEEDYEGLGKFRHLESMSLKRLKLKIRSKYNPYFKGVMSHNHVVHGTDNHTQVMSLLDLANFPESIIFNHNRSVPWFLNIEQYKCKLVRIENLYCRNLTHDGGTKIIPLSRSVQYKFLEQNDGTYQAYVSKHIGYGLQSYYSQKKYLNLKSSMKDFYDPSRGNIIVEQYDNSFVILDGLHRAAILLDLGVKEGSAWIV